MRQQKPDHDSRNRIRRRARIAGLIAAILIPVVVIGARSSIDSMRITPEKWVPEGDPQRQAFEKFRQEFEGNDIVYVSWDGCTVDDNRLARLDADLRRSNRLPAQSDVRPFERVITGFRSLRQMQEAPLRLTREEALTRLEGFLIGADRRTTCAVVVLTFAGNEHRRASIEHLKQVAVSATGLSSDALIFAGPPHDGVAIDTESVRGVNVYSTGATIVAAILCWWCLKAWRISAIVIGISCLGQGVVLSAVWFSGMTLDAILIVSPALVFVLTVSAGIHFVNYYQHQSGLLSHEEAVLRALDEGWRPCWIATLTTAAGLCSLAVSRVAPVAAFGMVSAAGLLVTVSLLMCIIPDALLRWPPSRSVEPSAAADRALQSAARYVSRRAGLITIFLMICMAGAALGLRNVRTSVDASGLFGHDTKIMRDYRWMESRIGASVPVEVVLTFSPASASRTPDQLQIVRRIQEAVSGINGITGTMSAWNYLPSRLTQPSASRVADYILRRRLTETLPVLCDLNYVHESDAGRSWRITGRVFATAGVSYGEIRNNIRQQIVPLLGAAEGPNASPSDAITGTVTGMMPLIDDVQMSILTDLRWSLCTAFALIGLVILLVLRSVRMAIAATLLNMLPVLLVFGAMGLADRPIDIGTMMTAAVAMGIAVDDTVHFLCFYRRRAAETGHSDAAVSESIRTCGAAMLKTTLICSSAMLVFAVSGFVPTRQFGLIMAAILLAAVGGDLICLPALLHLRDRRRKPPVSATSNNPVSEPRQSVPV